MKTRKLKDYQNIDFDIQTIATELDTSVNDLRYISRDDMEDGISLDNFDTLFEGIRMEGEITAFTDDMSLYEYECEPFILISKTDEKIIIFDIGLRSMIEGIINSVKNLRI